MGVDSSFLRNISYFPVSKHVTYYEAVAIGKEGADTSLPA